MKFITKMSAYLATERLLVQQQITFRRAASRARDLGWHKIIFEASSWKNGITERKLDVRLNLIWSCPLPDLLLIKPPCRWRGECSGLKGSAEWQKLQRQSEWRHWSSLSLTCTQITSTLVSSIYVDFQFSCISLLIWFTKL